MADSSCGNHEEEEGSRNGSGKLKIENLEDKETTLKGGFFSGLQTLEVKDVLDSRETKVRNLLYF